MDWLVEYERKRLVALPTLTNVGVNRLPTCTCGCAELVLVR